jgi:hypothetical protein
MSALAIPLRRYENLFFPRVHIPDMAPERPTRYTEDGIEILDEHVVHQSGSFCRVRRWLRGVHPHHGVITWGYTGWETLVEKDVIRPMHTFTVLP